MIKYAAFPGYVCSDDGARHFISAHTVMELHGLNPAECVCLKSAEDGRCRQAARDLISLFPRSDGDYDLPDSETGQPVKRVK